MENSYIFSLEHSLRETLHQFDTALRTDRKDLEHYKASVYKKDRKVEKWENKITAYMDGYNDFEFLLNRAITVDHERSTYLRQINKLRDDVKRLNKYLSILSVTKKLEIEEQVKFRTEIRIKQLCNLADDEFIKEMDLIKQANSIYTKPRGEVAQ